MRNSPSPNQRNFFHTKKLCIIMIWELRLCEFRCAEAVVVVCLLKTILFTRYLIIIKRIHKQILISCFIYFSHSLVYNSGSIISLCTHCIHGVNDMEIKEFDLCISIFYCRRLRGNHNVVCCWSVSVIWIGGVKWYAERSMLLVADG